MSDVVSSRIFSKTLKHSVDSLYGTDCVQGKGKNCGVCSGCHQRKLKKMGLV